MCIMYDFVSVSEGLNFFVYFPFESNRNCMFVFLGRNISIMSNTTKTSVSLCFFERLNRPADVRQMSFLVNRVRTQIIIYLFHTAHRKSS